jgi:hypothetical protein
VVHRRLKIAPVKVEKGRFLPKRRAFLTPKPVRFCKTNYAKSFIYNKSLSSFPLFQHLSGILGPLTPCSGLPSLPLNPLGLAFLVILAEERTTFLASCQATQCPSLRTDVYFRASKLQRVPTFINAVDPERPVGDSRAALGYYLSGILRRPWAQEPPPFTFPPRSSSIWATRPRTPRVREQGTGNRE